MLPFIVIGLTSGAVYALAGLGLVMTHKTSSVFNFALGALATVGACAFSHFTVGSHIPWFLALFLCGLVAVPIGATFDDAWRIYCQQLFYPYSARAFTIGRAAHQPEMQPDEYSLAILKRMSAAIDENDAFKAIGL